MNPERNSRADLAAPALRDLERACEERFPYQCWGAKTISADGRKVSCSCGDYAINEVTDARDGDGDAVVLSTNPRGIEAQKKTS